MKEIKLTQGKVAVVDDADFDWLNSVYWHARCDKGKTWYAKCHVNRNRKDVTVGMHQLLAAVMGISKPDHKDGNGLNNQRENLRAATHQQNCANRGRRSDNTSGFIGVSWNRCCRKWRALGIKDGIRQHIGYFDTAEEAARARDVFVIKTYGEFARLNFPNETATF